MSKYTIFKDGEIEKYMEGDEDIPCAIVVDSFPAAKKAALGALLLKVDIVTKMKMRDLND
jgi:hypothetical protein